MKKPYLKMWYTEFCLRRAAVRAYLVGRLFAKEHGESVSISNWLEFWAETQKDQDPCETLAYVVEKPSWLLVALAKSADKWMRRSLRFWDQIVDFV